MIREELRQLATTPRDLRKFGLMVGTVFLLLGGWFLYRHKPMGPWLAPPGVLLVVLGALAPRILKPVYLAWMTLALVLGLIVSTVLLTLFFCLVITPTGWIARLVGKDFLSRKLDPKARSYWIAKAAAPAGQVDDYERQY